MRDALRFFDAIASRYDRVYALPSADSRVRMARILRELPPCARVLDLGVGTGRELPALLDAGHTPTGLDFSSEMILLCKRRARPISIVRADFWERLPFGDASFDSVLALHGTLAHPPRGDGGGIPPSFERALGRLANDIARVLAPGGVFMAEVPTLAWLDTVSASPTLGPDTPGSARRTAADGCVHEDRATGFAIEAVVLAPERWRALLEPPFAVAIEAIGDHEMLIVARLLA
jgi:SAM-dependent methyltransferase